MRVVLIKNDRAGTYVSYLTSGKVYIAEHVNKHEIDPTTIFAKTKARQGSDELYKLYSDRDTLMYTALIKSSHLNGEDWEVIETMEV